MKSLTILFSFVLSLLISEEAIGQQLKTNLFLRTPQVVNYNLGKKDLSYSPLMSVGVGFSHRSKFIELATFIDSQNQYGFYTFFGTTLQSKNLGNNWFLNTNWFGEITYMPNQSEVAKSTIYTSGFCFFLFYSFDWGSIGLPLCIGTAYANNNFSLNTRTIFNASINLH